MDGQPLQQSARRIDWIADRSIIEFSFVLYMPKVSNYDGILPYVGNLP